MKYKFILHENNGNEYVLGDLSAKAIPSIQSYSFSLSRFQKGKYEVINLEVFSDEDSYVYLSLMGEGEGKFLSFNGVCEEERIFRQSPHDAGRYHFKMEKSAIPMVAAVTETQTDIVISDNPSFFDNATTQHIIPEERKFYISSGDKGGTPNNSESDPFGSVYHHIQKGTSHIFRFIFFATDEKELKGVRKEAYLAIEKFGEREVILFIVQCALQAIICIFE